MRAFRGSWLTDVMRMLRPLTAGWSGITGVMRNEVAAGQLGRMPLNRAVFQANGLTMLRPSTSRPARRSSVSRVSQPAASVMALTVDHGPVLYGFHR